MSIMWQAQQLNELTVKELKAKYLEAIGEEARSNNKQHLIRKILRALQPRNAADQVQGEAGAADEAGANEAVTDEAVLTDAAGVPPEEMPTEEALTEAPPIAEVVLTEAASLPAEETPHEEATAPADSSGAEAPAAPEPPQSETPSEVPALTQVAAPERRHPRPVGRDPRLPPAGTWLEREYKGNAVRVLVLDDGFEYQEKRYKSLSAVAKEATGTTWNGMVFFGCAKRPKAAA